jgi:hypothetical protein
MTHKGVGLMEYALGDRKVVLEADGHFKAYSAENT